ncbi:MAG: MauE/DoxX family redox-associated membrane protein [Bacteroidota bacterium]
MKRTYTIVGMTCQNCVASVQKKLQTVAGIDAVEVDLYRSQAILTMKEQFPLKKLQEVLPQKYVITELKIQDVVPKEKSKWNQLQPLFLIFGYLFSATILLNYKDWSIREAMLDFMGLFYIVFSFFKFLDLKGFPKSFGMYDPLAKAVPFYGWAYPFLELGLGVLFLMRFQVQLALWVTLIALGTTTFGVVKTLFYKKSIRCACLGTALNLPMTEATFVENSIMLVMAFWMLFA